MFVAFRIWDIWVSQVDPGNISVSGVCSAWIRSMHFWKIILASAISLPERYTWCFMFMSAGMRLNVNKSSAFVHWFFTGKFRKSLLKCSYFSEVYFLIRLTKIQILSDRFWYHFSIATREHSWSWDPAP